MSLPSSGLKSKTYEISTKTGGKKILPCCCWFLLLLTYSTVKIEAIYSLEIWLTFNREHGITSHKIEFFTATAVRIFNSTTIKILIITYLGQK